LLTFRLSFTGASLRAEKAAISYYDFVEIQDADGYRVGTQSRIKLHNKMSALDKIARHLDFYGTLGKEGKGEREKAKSEGDGERQKGEREKEENGEDGLLVITPTKAVVVEEETAVAVVDRSVDNLPMDYPVEDFELEGIDLKTQMALEGVNVSPGGRKYQVASIEYQDEENELLLADENMENILTISPLVKKSQEPRIKSQDLLGGDGVREFALGMRADTGLEVGLGQAVAKACAV
jgi:hypothetical protein